MKTFLTQSPSGPANFAVLLFACTLCISLFSLPVSGQPAIVWDKTLGGTYIDEARAVNPTSDGGFIVAGISYSGAGADKSQAARGNADYWVAKMRANGTKEWDKTFGGTGIDNLVTVQQTTDGGYILGGWSESDAGGDKSENDRSGTTGTRGDYWLVKLSASGARQWDRTLGGTSSEILKSVIQTADGGYIAAGTSGSPVGADKTNPAIGTGISQDYWIVRLTANGTKVWDKTLGTTDWDELGGMDINEQGGYTLIGLSRGTASGWQILKLSTTGIVQSQRKLAHSVNGYISEIHHTADNGYIVGVRTEPQSLGYQAVKLDAAGDQVWEKFFRGVNHQGTSNSEQLTSIIQAPDGGYLLAGYTFSDAGRDKSEDHRGEEDFWVVRLGADGSKHWDKTLGGSRQDLAFAITRVADGSYVVAGTSFSGAGNEKSENARGENDFWIVKLDSGAGKPMLSFSASQLNFTVNQGASAPPQAVMLAALQGEPALSLAKSPNSSWLVLPQASTGTLSFGINAGGLVPGVYTAEVTASAAGYVSAHFSVSLTVLSTSKGTTVRINAGGNAFTTSDGRTFSADMYYGGVNRVHSIPSGDIIGTNDDGLYRSERSSATFSYNVPVKNGDYMIVLHFAEIWFGAPGGRPLQLRQRLFNIDLEGYRIYTDYNVVAHAGAPMKMTREVFPAIISDGTVNLGFSAGAADLPTLAALEIIPLAEFSTELELPVLADATVRDGSFANQNMGTLPVLDVKSGPGDGVNRNTYLRFSTLNLSDIYAARLRIYGNNAEAGTNVNLSVYGVDNDAWTETGITWNNAPQGIAAADGYVNVNSTQDFYEVDVTRYVRQQTETDRLVSFVLKNPTAKNRRLAFDSRENTSGNAPKLIVVTREGFSDTYRKAAAAENTALNILPAEAGSIILPNPVAGTFRVRVSDQHHGKTSYRAISQSGQEVIPLESSNMDVQTRETEISGQMLRTGLYLLKIQSESAAETLKLMIVK
ncbi:CBM96 family carbohydrate-binding protein [Dyadobacter sandarakinus]|uniref:DNRLRE domain-containing protein n=1 Tax=Dyadobacter sandarakinus TaxID=2747268 RepID=A0ABX7I8S0_9BACT|nr:malectin domain-containing carbohydrate-binding protein [Dyadobacter sandarakinus]QRR02499.1 DNRLRE domain-containing protein [Dyadobacter sandarakinus]